MSVMDSNPSHANKAAYFHKSDYFCEFCCVMFDTSSVLGVANRKQSTEGHVNTVLHVTLIVMTGLGPRNTFETKHPV